MKFTEKINLILLVLLVPYWKYVDPALVGEHGVFPQMSAMEITFRVIAVGVGVSTTLVTVLLTIFNGVNLLQEVTWNGRRARSNKFINWLFRDDR